MQLTSVLLPLLSLAATSLSTPVPAAPEKRSAAGCFEISNFRNSGSPHSISASVSFTLTDPSASLVASCYASLSIQPSIVTTQFPTACNDTSLVFGVEYKPSAPGYWLDVAHIYNGNKTVDAGSVWLASDVRRFDNPSGNPNGDYDYLNYPADFTVAYNRHTTEEA